MKYYKFFVIILILTASSSLFSQTYISPKQKTTTNGFANRVETELIKKVVIDETTFSAELPEGGLLSGNIEFWKTIDRSPDEKRIMYNIEGGGLISVNDDLLNDNWDCIVINLMGTNKKKIYTFWLTNGNKGDD